MKIALAVLIGIAVMAIHSEFCVHGQLLPPSEQPEAKKPTTQLEADFKLAMLSNAPVSIKLATPVTTPINFSLLPSIRYAISGTNRYRELLIGTAWLLSSNQTSGTKVQEMNVGCFVPTVTDKAEDELWTKTWRFFTNVRLQQTVSGKGAIRIALFEARKDGGYGKQVSNVLEVPIEVSQMGLFGR